MWELDGRSVPNKSILSFIYLLILCPVCTCEHTDHGTLGPTGRLTLHPWPPSAGQTLTLEQMDNGLCALSAPVHTLLLPALDTAFPFTSCCPPFLFFHLPCPAFDCLNSLFSHFYYSLPCWTPALLLSIYISSLVYYFTFFIPSLSSLMQVLLLCSVINSTFLITSRLHHQDYQNMTQKWNGKLWLWTALNHIIVIFALFVHLVTYFTTWWMRTLVLFLYDAEFVV